MHVNKFSTEPNLITKFCRVENQPFINSTFSKNSWDKHCSAFNNFKKFELENGAKYQWPLNTNVILDYCNWAIRQKQLDPKTVESYVHTLKIMHDLMDLDCSGCKNQLVKMLIRGAENRQIYAGSNSRTRNVITLPLLKLIGHEIAMQNWNTLNKQIFWTACCLAFFGSLRMGEILFSSESSFDPNTSFLWGDIQFRENSLLCHIKSPKSKNKGGDWIDIFEFPGNNCCPVKSMQKLKDMVGKIDPKMPVFRFQSGKLLTKVNFNSTISGLLKKFEEKGAKFSGHSFRAGIPATLAKFPELVNDNHIQGWGRWGSKAYLVYTKLKLEQKRKIYAKIVECLTKK